MLCKHTITGRRHGECPFESGSWPLNSNDMANNNSSGGISLTGLLTIVFIVLKLTGNIDWSWWWVLSPIWIMVLIALVVILGYLIFEILTR